MSPLKGIVFPGDSLTARWNVAALVPGAVNAGHPGHTARDLYPRFFSEALDLNPRRVVLLIGTNDALRRQHVEYGLIRSMALAACRRRIPLILCNLPPIQTDAAALNPIFSAAIAEANIEIASIAADVDCKLVDYHSVMVSGGAQIASYFIDGVHPSAAGYEAMWSVLHPALS